MPCRLCNRVEYIVLRSWNYWRGVLISEGGTYVQALMELGPEDVSLLERCPHFSKRYTDPGFKTQSGFLIRKKSDFCTHNLHQCDVQ